MGITNKMKCLAVSFLLAVGLISKASCRRLWQPNVTDPVVYEKTLDDCCPGAKVNGLSYGLVYPNTTFGLANSCGSSCPYLLQGAEDSSDVKCFDTANNEDICVLPRLDKRGRNNAPIPLDKVPPPNKRSKDALKICGWVYEHAYYRGTAGYTAESQAWMSGNFNHHFHDRVSSVKVTDGCKMYLFRDFNLRGPSRTFEKSSAWIGWDWNDSFSSMMCTCEHHEVSVELVKRKCSFSRMRNGASCTLYQLSDLSWNTAEELIARAKQNRNRSIASRKAWEGALITEDTYEVGYVKAAVGVKKGASLPEYGYATKLGIMHINNAKKSKPIETVDFDLFSGSTSAKVNPTFAGADAKLVLVGGSVSIFDLQIGVGVAEEVGYDINSHSVKVEFAGTGVSLGGQTGICVFDNCFFVNFNRVFSG